MSLKIKVELLEDKKKNCFPCLGTRKNLSLGEFDEPETHLFLVQFYGIFLEVYDSF